MISAFIANGNAPREVVELLGHVCLNFTLIFDVLFFDMLFFALREVVELLGHVCLNFSLFHHWLPSSGHRARTGGFERSF